MNTTTRIVLHFLGSKMTDVIYVIDWQSAHLPVARASGSYLLQGEVIVFGTVIRRSSTGNDGP